ncbi:flagellar basal body P-ring biosynthesis protein FlgA [Stieleria neptunia]|uniref:Flagellar basal body P-ring biosynthesis protein FlgA n=1 Tax=Stieleria neptunia TaxID=2527979 RepID=A0A518HTK7_9BACT|nr:flagellar basal body P-ring formation chaperone FlgA [Stieleria neptunia]QDV44133.1 flagellar basal body P-ring biosynthesis protein FlgA [Stieleria neptunia]
MMKSVRIVALLISFLVLARQDALSAGDVVVALHQTSSTVADTTVRIGDIANVLNATPSQRRDIEQLDLESLRDQDDCSITRKHVEMRLLLAGYERHSFNIIGPSTVSARRSSPAKLRSKLEQLLASDLGRQFAVAPERVAIRLTQTPQLATLEPKLAAGDFAVDLIPRNAFPIGRTRLAVAIIDSAGNQYSHSFDAQVSLSMKVAIASQPIAQGTVLKPDMFRLVDRSITQNADYANPDSTVGRTASRYIASNTILLTNHFHNTRAGHSQTVKRNDLVDVVISVGQGEIRLKNARAMEAGQIGDMIEVLNPQTNRRFNASIIGPNLATVSSNSRRR